MLVQLRVIDLALIEDLTLNFGSGLNILSGETGAGKSILISAINLLLGERAFSEHIRQGRETACVEGIVCPDLVLRGELDNYLHAAGISAEEDLIIAREIYRSGRSAARINGRTVPVSMLKELGQLLIDLHGQHQHQSLLRPDQHLELLDSFGVDTIGSCRDRLDILFKKRQLLKKELAELGENSGERERRLDILTFQLKEIKDAVLTPGEDEELMQKENVLANAEKICMLAAKAYSDLYTGEDDGQVEAIIDRLNRSFQVLTEAASLDKRLQPLLEMLESSSAQLEEVAHELRDYQSGLEFEPSELAVIQDRINVINSVKRKYGATVEEVMAYADRIEKDIDRLKNSEENARKIESDLDNIEKQLTEESIALRTLRKKTADELKMRLEESLRELALPNARFEVKFNAKDTFSPKGMDQIEFLFSANLGEDVKPLSKIISGGEVSRVMLALKTILARQDLVPTLIFDEVDAGVGGATIQAVAEKLTYLAQHHQVMCVTHSPQIASMADNHFRFFKETVGERTLTMAANLNEEEKREELARMLDGANIDQVSLKHVDSLIERAKRFKKELAG